MFELGFSAEKNIDIIGGRCIGMNEVKKRIENLNGRIDVEFEEGKYCEFTITLPLDNKNHLVENIHINHHTLN